MVARVGCAVADAVMLAVALALGARRDTFRPALLFNVFETRAVVRKFVLEVPHGVAKRFWDVLFDFVFVCHNEVILASALTCCQGILTIALALTFWEHERVWRPPLSPPDVLR